MFKENMVFALDHRDGGRAQEKDNSAETNKRIVRCVLRPLQDDAPDISLNILDTLFRHSVDDGVDYLHSILMNEGGGQGFSELAIWEMVSEGRLSLQLQEPSSVVVQDKLDQIVDLLKVLAKEELDK